MMAANKTSSGREASNISDGLTGQLSTPRSLSYDGSFNTDLNKKSKKHTHWLHIGVCVFFLVNIIVLYVLHFTDRSDVNMGKFEVESLNKNGPKAQEGAAVSVDSEGNIRIGAGTTAYLEATKLPIGAMKFINFAPMGTSKNFYKSNIMSFVESDGKQDKSYLTLCRTNEDMTLTIEETDETNTLEGKIRGISTLSDSMAVLLLTTSDPSLPVYATPAKIGDDKIEVLKNEQKLATNGSVTTFMSRLSDSEFTLAYYESYSEEEPYYQRFQVGTVEEDGKISFSKSVQFGDANGAQTTTFGRPQAVGKSTTHFVVPWFHAGAPTSTIAEQAPPNNSSIGLCLTVGNFDRSNKNLSIVNKICYKEVQPAYFVDSTSLTDDVVAFACYDRSNNGKPTFRSTYVLEEASGAIDFGGSMAFNPKPVITMLNGNRLSISFFNPSNDGKPSVKVLQYGEDLSFQDVSPIMPVTNGDFTMVTPKASNAFGSITLEAIAIESGVIIGYAGSYGEKQHQRITLVETLSSPLGVVSDVDGKSSEVVTNGIVEVDDAKFTAGKSYYTSTYGTLYSAKKSNDGEFILADDGKLVISKNSFVGVAVSDDKIFLSGTK
jgi:hypothetical protein